MRAQLIIATVLISAVTATAQSIPNASFESPGFSGSGDFIVVPAGNFITGWTITGAGMDYFTNANNPLFATDGQYSINYIRGTGQFSTIFTTISGLTIGLAYDVSFDLIQTNPSASNALTASVDSTSLTFINSLSNVWQTRDLMFTATAATATLTFAGPTSGADDSAFAHIDNVRIAAVPEPSVLISCLIGSPLLTFAIRRLRRS